MNIREFIDVFGLNHCALLTLVFPRHVTWDRANHAITNVQRILLDPFFQAWISVVELHKDGRPHFHMLLASESDLRTGFDFGARDEAFAIERKAHSQDRPMTPEERIAHRTLLFRSSVDVPALQALWSTLRAKLPHYGCGRSHPGSFEPVRLAVGLSVYLGKSFGEGALPRPFAMKGAHFIRYSRNAPRAANPNFAWSGENSRRTRCQLARIADVLGVEDGEFASLFGPRWYRRCENLIAFLEYEHETSDQNAWSVENIRRGAEGLFLDPGKTPIG